MAESRHVIGSRGEAPADDQHPKSDAGAPSPHPGKMKRTLTPGNFFKTVANVVASGPVLLAALFRPKTSAALREKVMLGVTSVTTAGTASGVTPTGPWPKACRWRRSTRSSAIRSSR